MADTGGFLARALESRWFYGLIAVVLVGLFVVSQLRPADFDGRPYGEIEDLSTLAERDDLNVLFILIDTMRADRMGLYGYERDVSPHLDRLASTGIRFSQHQSQSSWTKASMASMWTGLNPARTGISRYMHSLPESAELPSETLKDAGFVTIGLWRNGWVAPNFGFDQGFDAYSRPVPVGLPGKLRREHPAATISGSDANLVESAIEFLRTVDPNDRWFLYLHTMDVHQYVSDETSAMFGTTYSDFYDNAIHWTDRNLGRLLRELGERGMLERTLVVVTSDHGEAFKEHGREGHARDLYGEVTEIPLLVSLPFKLKEGLEVAAPTSNIDVWPTIFDLIGIEGPADADGRSLVTLIEQSARGEVPPPGPPQFAQLDRGWGRPEQDSEPIFSVTENGYRAHLDPKGALELYDLERDPREQEDISETNPELGAVLRSRIEEYEASSQIPWVADEVELDGLMLHQLKALGYHLE